MNAASAEFENALPRRILNWAAMPCYVRTRGGFCAETTLFFYTKPPLLRSLFSLVFAHTRPQNRRFLILNGAKPA
jgi:hypothetical protein